MSALEQATVDQVTVNLTYTAAEGQTTRREVEPMIFALTAGQWKLVAWCRLREGIRWFALTRIQRATVTRHPCTGHQIEEIGKPPTLAHSVHF
ncbi:helix-turn-helix transcriptional regulator [Cryobacterium serini]|uniref:WYL domain-containing protein n=1 Tax=Cryobacterium serini TaxID=1259201 RepID=A0A4R9BIW2_9MICO|nr:WYL domain-containing protein [Cryobacterium serini]